MPAFNMSDDGVTRNGGYLLNEEQSHTEDSINVKKSMRNGTMKHSQSYTNGRIANRSISSESETYTSYSRDEQVTVLVESAIYTRKRLVAVLSHVDEGYIHEMTIDGFLGYIERQRLTHMPHRGSRWDKCLKWAEFFGLQISGYAKVVEGFLPESNLATRLIFAACRTLLDLGHDNVKTIEITFGVFYQLGLALSLLLRHNLLLHATQSIRHDVGHAFDDLLALTREVTMHYHAAINGLAHGQINLDFTSLFGKYIDAFWSRKDSIMSAMWKHQLPKDTTVDIKILRSWLNTRDRKLKTYYNERSLTPAHRDEFTCEWYQRTLLDFSRSKDDVLACFAAEGCGKTHLARWVVERLQRPISKKNYDTLFYAVESDIPATTASIALAKSLSLQLFEKNVGDVSLYYALVKAFTAQEHKVEEALWKALDDGLHELGGKGKDNLMIVVDGVDELQNLDVSKFVMEKLGALTAKHGRLQAITFSRVSPSKPIKGRFQPFEIKSDHTHEDARHMTEHALRGYVHYEDQSEHEQEAIVERLIHAARGNFLWLMLTVAQLREEQSHGAFLNAVKILKEQPLSMKQVIDKAVETLDLSRPDVYLILSWMLVAKRPLTTAEVKCLLQVDTSKKHIVERKIDIKANIEAALGPFVSFRKNFVRFRHPAIRDHLLGLQLKGTTKLLKPGNAHSDLITRLFLYSKLAVPEREEPSFEMISWPSVKDAFDQYVLLEYAVRNWTDHLRVSSMYSVSGQSLKFPSDFKDFFVDSTYFARLEWVCWDTQAPSIEHFDFALRVRETAFGGKHESVLQSLIICGSHHRSLSNMTEASICFYRASRIGQAILRKNHNLVLTCATTFLTISETFTLTSRTEMTTRKEEILKYVIEVYKHQYGRSHDLVIRHYKMLAQLYIDIHEEQRAESVWRELHEIVITRFGQGSEEESSISEQITIVLKRSDKEIDIIEYEKSIFDVTVGLEIWDIRRIQLSLELAMSYESRKEYWKSEELYITLWRRLIERCHHPGHHHGVEIHIYAIDVVIEYVRFLRRGHRHQEAANILICIWSEYEEYHFESETLYLRLKIIGELMQSVSLFTIAITIFKKCLAWFKSHGKVEHIASVDLLITQTIDQIVTTTSTTSTTTTTTTTSSTEVVMTETFESTLKRKEVSSETISICKSLISYHMRLEQYSEAVQVIKQSLTVIWRFIVSGNGTIALPSDFGGDAVDIAIDLAICHHRCHHYHEAEEIYIRIYHACRNSCHVEDARFVKCSGALLRFYEEHKHWRQIIEIHEELLIRYRKTFGASHKLIIKTLYTLGALCSDHSHGTPRQYYEEIIMVLNRGLTVCHVDALDAMFVMCRVHYEAGHWHESRIVCKVLWETWVHHHHGHDKFTMDFVQTLYLRYRYVLEHHEVCEYSVLRQLTVEYRQTCIKVFGATATISIEASIQLAEICLRSETHIHEAISIFEEVLTVTRTSSSTTIVSTTTLTKIKKSLTKAYVSVCSHSSTSVATIERAVVMIRERFDSLKITLGWAHAETLTCLRDYAMLQLKIKKQETHSTIIHVLSETCIEIIKKETHSKTLHEAAKSLGSIYVSCGLMDQGCTMVDDVRIQIVSGISKDGSSHKLGTTVGKESYVFLVSFEQIVRGYTVSYSEFMASLLTETILYESYHRSVRAEKNVTVILTHAARLRSFLAAHVRSFQKTQVERDAFKIFIKKWQSTIKCTDNVSFTFFLALLDELDNADSDAQIGNVACASSIAVVRKLLNERRIQDAYEVANCALDFITSQRGFHLLRNVGYGFKLSALMVGRGLDAPLQPDINPKLFENMHELSRKIIRQVLQACKDSNINFVRLKLHELNDLAGLLGEQQNFADLEWLLNLLWTSREVQKSWDSDLIVKIGKYFVQARYLNPNKDVRTRAIRLCEDICYNLRRVWGSLDPSSLKMSELLSEIYTSMGHYREAQGVHEGILRLVVEGDDGDDGTRDTVDAATARRHLDLLKQSFLRLKGWDKSAVTYRELVNALVKLYRGASEFKDVPANATDAWDHKKEQPSETFGKFVPPKKWDLVETEFFEDEAAEEKRIKKIRRPGMGVKRATSNWGICEVRRVLHGEDEYDDPAMDPAKVGGVGETKSALTNGHREANDEEEL